MDFLEFAKERYSCRKFSDKPEEQEKIDKIVKAAMLAPTSVNKQPFKVFEIKGAGNIEKLKKVTPYTFGTSVVLAVGAKKEDAFTRQSDNKNFAEIDATIVATHIMLEVHDLGLGTTWVGYFDEAEMKKDFPQMKDYDFVALFPVGYPADDAQPSPKHDATRAKEEIFEVIE